MIHYCSQCILCNEIKIVCKIFEICSNYSVYWSKYSRLFQVTVIGTKTDIFISIKKLWKINIFNPKKWLNKEKSTKENNINFHQAKFK